MTFDTKTLELYGFEITLKTSFEMIPIFYIFSEFVTVMKLGLVEELSLKGLFTVDVFCSQWRWEGVKSWYVRKRTKKNVWGEGGF
jgi:hypothetical protein